MFETKVRNSYITVEITVNKVDMKFNYDGNYAWLAAIQAQSPPTSFPTRFWPLLALQLRHAFHT